MTQTTYLHSLVPTIFKNVPLGLYVFLFLTLVRSDIWENQILVFQLLKFFFWLHPFFLLKVEVYWKRLLSLELKVLVNPEKPTFRPVECRIEIHIDFFFFSEFFLGKYRIVAYIFSPSFCDYDPGSRLCQLGYPQSGEIILDKAFLFFFLFEFRTPKPCSSRHLVKMIP